MFNFFLRRNRYAPNLKYRVIQYEKLRQEVTNLNNIIIDVRDENEYNIMHIVNSVNIPVNKLRINENEYKNKEKIIVYCSTGERTIKSIGILNNLGYYNVYNWQYGTLSNFPFKDLIKF